MDFAFSEVDEAFRSEVREWLAEHLVGEFAALGTSADLGEGPQLETRKAWEQELAKYTLWSFATRRPEVLEDALALRVGALEAAEIVLRVAHQLHGAIGFCDETPLSWVSRLSVPIRRLPFGLSATRAELTRRIGRRGLTGLFSTLAAG